MCTGSVGGMSFSRRGELVFTTVSTNGAKPDVDGRKTLRVRPYPPVKPCYLEAFVIKKLLIVNFHNSRSVFLVFRQDLLLFASELLRLCD